MVSFPSPFWREKETKETKETHNQVLFVWEREEEREKKLLFQVIWKPVVGWREESLQSIY